MCKFEKLIVDNREDVQPFYDGVSMGGGVIQFECANCCKVVGKETFHFLNDENKPTKEQKELLSSFFKVVKEPYFGQRPEVGFIACPGCKQNYSVYIGFGEVQSGRYQTSLVAVAKCTV